MRGIGVLIAHNLLKKKSNKNKGLLYFQNRNMGDKFEVLAVGELYRFCLLKQGNSWLLE